MSDRYRRLATLVFVAAAVAALTGAGSAQQAEGRGPAPRTAQTPPPALHQRIRDVRQGPDGLLYALTEENEAALLRFEPVAAPAT